jgi:outer membrane protein OmpA-like peptidoglycan-associated protein
MKNWIPIAALLLLVLSACRPKPAPAPPAPPIPQNAVVLLPEDDGTTGKIQFTNAGGSVELNQPNTLTLVAAQDVAPGQPLAIDAAEIARRFGAALDSLPAPQAEFVLYFELGADRLTAESEALIPQLLKAVADRQSTDVSIAGHTDTTGTAASNYDLALRRAERVAAILLERGLQREFLSVESHGEGNPLIRTPDNVEEPRNRRVEVIVR